MEFDRKLSPLDSALHQALLTSEAEKQGKIAAAREQQRADYEANTTARTCLGCETEFRSEGIHNRLCRRCRSRR